MTILKMISRHRSVTPHLAEDYQFLLMHRVYNYIQVIAYQRIKGKADGYPKHGAICLATQCYPDSPNHSNFASSLLRPRETFNSHTKYVINIENE